MNIKTNNFLSILALLILATATLMSVIPTINAQNVSVAAQLAVNPNPTGVGQTVDVIVWCQPIPPEGGEVFNGFTVTVTKPGGATDTLGPADSWAVGAYAFRYTPTEIGEYSFVFNYPGQTMSSGEEYQPAVSETVTLVVQQDRIEGMPTVPLPEYIDGIVNSENREWADIVGSWMMTYYDSTYTGYGDSGGGYNPYTRAPRSPHIRWTIQAATGGLPGGESGTAGVYSGLSYTTYGNPPIIMHNKLFVNTNPTLGHFRSTSGEGFACYDLQTGEQLWSRNDGGITHGQHFRSYSPGRPGIFSFLWDLDGTNNRWEVYDPFDGSLEMVFENITKTGTNWWWEDAVVYGPNGDIYVYILDGYANELTMWNSTKAFWGNGILSIGSDGVERFSWSTLGFGGETAIDTLYDWEKGIEWTVTIPDRNVDWHTPYSIFGISDGVIIAKSGTAGNWIDYDIAYDLDTGAEIWIHNKEEAVQSFYNSVGEGITASFDLTTRKWTGFDIETGQKLWDTPPMDYPWGTYSSYGSTIANGQLFSGSFDGHLYAYDIGTGAVNWKFYSGDSGIETVMGTWPMWQGPLVADGVVFCGTGEETPTQPLTRGNRVFAVDANNGQEIWHIAGYMSLKAVAEGVLIGYNGYDSRIYCFGKGPSATTVSGPQSGVSVGNSITITGMVTDQSEGQKDTPAISDADMGAWMEYLHMQKPKPTNAKGVPVSIVAISSDGSVQEIGTATSDMYGNYGIAWTPQNNGLYQIVAEFAGSESYGSSTASTYINVGGSGGQASPTQPEPTSPGTVSTEMYLIAAAVAIVIVVVIVAAVFMRRRK